MAHEALARAASALWNAHNALNIARAYSPRADTPQTIDPVQADILEALEAIAAVIGEKATLEA